MNHPMNQTMQYPQMNQGMNQGMNMQAQYPQQGMPMQGQAYYPGYPMYQQQSSFFSFANDRFIKGALIGAAAAYLLTNESVQRNAIKGAVKVWSLLQGGVEEMKERFHDAEAEIRAEQGE